MIADPGGPEVTRPALPPSTGPESERKLRHETTRDLDARVASLHNGHMPTTRAMFDTSAIRNLEKDRAGLELVRAAISSGRIVAIVPRTVSDQLWAGHRSRGLAGTPPFPAEYVGNSVARAGLMAAGDSLGSGVAFDVHMGAAHSDSQIADALIVDAATWDADILVSDDRRFRRRAESIRSKLQVLDLQLFLELIDLEPSDAVGVSCR